MSRRVNTVTVALLAPRGSEPSFARAEAERSVKMAGDFFARETDGALQLRLDRVVDWQRVDADLPCSWSGALLDWAQPRIGWSRSPGRHLVAMVPTNGGCPDWANGEQNDWVGAGGRTFQPGADPNFLVHELGHNMSLTHAYSVQCKSAWDFSTIGAGVPSGCHREEYGNLLDAMGASWTLDDPLSSPELDRLGMLPRHYEPRCGAMRRLTIPSITNGASRRRAVSWLDPGNPEARYWVDLRTDTRTGRTGLQVMRTDPLIRQGTAVLERPGDTTDARQLLSIGELVQLGAGATLKLESVAGAGRSGVAAVTVPCQPGRGPSRTSTTMKLDTARTGHGGRVRATIRVAGATGSLGRVTMSAGNTVLASGRLDHTGTAVLTGSTASLPVGRQQLSAAYVGDAEHAASSASALLLVDRASTRTQVSTTRPRRSGRGAVATVRVTRDPSGALPTRVRLTLTDRRATVASRTLELRGGRARWRLPQLGRGRYTVRAVVADTALVHGSRARTHVRRR